MSEVAVIGPREVVITPEQTSLIKATVCQGATDAEMKLYFYDCQRRGVHPLDKLIHFTKRSGKYTPITSIDFMRQRAHASGAYAGTDEPVYTHADNQLEACTYSVYRIVQGHRCKWSATARWKEYYPGDAQGFMWKKMPYLMLSKCAEALALRQAFPDELQGLYVKEEMDQAETKPTILDHKREASKKIAELKIENGMVDIRDYDEPSLNAPEENGVGISSPPVEDRSPMQAQDAPAFIWRLGKHKGESIVTIPSEYLQWFTEQGKVQDHKAAAQDELNRRTGQGTL